MLFDCDVDIIVCFLFFCRSEHVNCRLLSVFMISVVPLLCSILIKRFVKLKHFGLHVCDMEKRLSVIVRS